MSVKCSLIVVYVSLTYSERLCVIFERLFLHKHLFEPFAHFFSWMVCLLLLSFFILWILDSYKICDLQIFSSIL